MLKNFKCYVRGHVIWTMVIDHIHGVGSVQAYSLSVYMVRDIYNMQKVFD